MEKVKLFMEISKFFKDFFLMLLTLPGTSTLSSAGGVVSRNLLSSTGIFAGRTLSGKLGVLRGLHVSLRV